MVIRLDKKPGSAAVASTAAVQQPKYPAPAVQVRESRDPPRAPHSDVTDRNPSLPVVMETAHSISSRTDGDESCDPGAPPSDVIDGNPSPVVMETVHTSKTTDEDVSRGDESRDPCAPPSDVTDRNPSPVVTETAHTATDGGEDSATSSVRSLSLIDDDFVRAAISIEGSRGTRQQQLAASRPPVTSTPKSGTYQKYVKKPATGWRDVELRQTTSSSSLSTVSSGRPSKDFRQRGSVVQQSTGTDGALPSAATAAAAAVRTPSHSASVDVGSDNEFMRSRSLPSIDAGSSVASRISGTSHSNRSVTSDDFTPTSTGAQQKMPQSSTDSRPANDEDQEFEFTRL